MTIELYCGDCIEVIPALSVNGVTVDAIITDLPYGTTACKWDVVIPFEPMWDCVKMILKKRGAFVTTASQPFTSALVMSNPQWFKYEWIWNKNSSAGFALAKIRPFIITENVCVFSSNCHTYNPQMEIRGTPRIKGGYSPSECYGGIVPSKSKSKSNTYYPKNIIDIGNASQKDKTHPTQKPVALYEYLIRTYTNEGETVLDMCIGSGSCGVACVNTGRNFIGIELDEVYFEIAQERIVKAQAAYQPELLK